MPFEYILFFSKLRENPYYFYGKWAYSRMQIEMALFLFGLLLGIFFVVLEIVVKNRGRSVFCIIPLFFIMLYTGAFCWWLLDIFLMWNKEQCSDLFTFVVYATGFLWSLSWCGWICIFDLKKIKSAINYHVVPAVKMCGVVSIIFFVIGGMVEGVSKKMIELLLMVVFKWIICFIITKYIVNYYHRKPWLLEKHVRQH